MIKTIKWIGSAFFKLLKWIFYAWLFLLGIALTAEAVQKFLEPNSERSKIVRGK